MSKLDFEPLVVGLFRGLMILIIYGMMMGVIWVICLTTYQAIFPPPPPFLALQTLCSNLSGQQVKQCDLLTTINALENNWSVNVVASSEEILQFTKERQINLQLFPKESRQLTFPYTINDTTLLMGNTVTGAYIIKVSVENSETGEEVSTERTQVFVRGGDTLPYLVPTLEEFTKFLPAYTNLTNTPLSFYLSLLDTEQPQQGMLNIRVPSGEDTYSPVITVKTSGGIKFSSAPAVTIGDTPHTAVGQPGTIWASGTRHLQFPFEVDSGSVDGVYAIVVHLKSSEEDISQQLPILIRVSSSSVKEGAKWLTIEDSS